MRKPTLLLLMAGTKNSVKDSARNLWKKSLPLSPRFNPSRCASRRHSELYGERWFIASRMVSFSLSVPTPSLLWPQCTWHAIPDAPIAERNQTSDKRFEPTRNARA